MKFGRPSYALMLLSAAVLACAAASPSRAADGRVSFLYTLSDFSGVVRDDVIRVFADDAHEEFYVIDADGVRVYNRTGMQIYRFGDDPDLASVYGIAVDEGGDIWTLSYDMTRLLPSGIRPFYLCRCDFRGEPREKVAIANLPPGYEGFSPDRLVYADGRFLLVSSTAMKGIAVDRGGAFERGFDFAALAGIEEKDRADNELFGIAVDRDGTFYFTVPFLFRVYRVAPGGKAEMFGKPGGAPGKFGVVSGIAVDRNGNIFVSDRLKDVVMVFDRNFNFLTEFGYRGGKPENLFVPTDLALDQSGKLYVTQVRRRGVSVFSVAFGPQSAAPAGDSNKGEGKGG